MNEMQIWLKPDRFKVVGFYPYTSIVQRRILSQSHNFTVKDHDFIQEFGNAIRIKAEELGCRWDNKVVVEIKSNETHDYFEQDSSLFVGYKDGVISIGLSVWQPDKWTAKENLKF